MVLACSASFRWIRASTRPGAIQAAWRATLDVDKSTLAVPLEQLVSFASEKVPDLLFEAFVDLGGGRQ